MNILYAVPPASLVAILIPSLAISILSALISIPSFWSVIPSLLFTKFLISSCDTSVPSEFKIVFTIAGCTTVPPLAIDEIYFAIWTGVKLLSPWPIAALSVSPGPQPSFLWANVPVFSLGNSIPVNFPNPKCKAYLAIASIPILSPAS